MSFRVVDRAAGLESAGAARTSVPRLHVITDDAVLARDDFLARATDVLERAGPAVALHVRAPHGTGAAVFRAAQALAPVARDTGARLLVNDRVDVALAARADGAHLGRRSLPPEAARRILGEEALLGVSAHDAVEAAAAGRHAGFLIVGAVYDTPSHPEGIPRGTGVISEVRSAAPRLPLLAIGGVTPERVAEVLEHGAHGVAVLGGVWEAVDAPAAVEDYLGALRGHRSNATES